jgi:hypothetical protein
MSRLFTDRAAPQKRSQGSAYAKDVAYDSASFAIPRPDVSPVARTRSPPPLQPITPHVPLASYKGATGIESLDALASAATGYTSERKSVGGLTRFPSPIVRGTPASNTHQRASAPGSSKDWARDDLDVEPTQPMVSQGAPRRASSGTKLRRGPEESEDEAIQTSYAQLARSREQYEETYGAAHGAGTAAKAQRREKDADVAGSRHNDADSDEEHAGADEGIVPMGDIQGLFNMGDLPERYRADFNRLGINLSKHYVYNAMYAEQADMWLAESTSDSIQCALHV